jgi:hypothetical protein
MQQPAAAMPADLIIIDIMHDGGVFLRVQNHFSDKCPLHPVPRGGFIFPTRTNDALVLVSCTPYTKGQHDHVHAIIIKYSKLTCQVALFTANKN